MADQREFNPGAQVFESQVVIRDATQGSNTSGALLVAGGVSASDTYVSGKMVVNNLDMTPNLNDIIEEEQIVLLPNITNPTDVFNFYFDNTVVSAFKANININASTNRSKFALWELNGTYKPSQGWILTSNFSGDVTGVNFSIRTTAQGFGQIQYTNSNTSGRTSMRYRAVTNAQPGTVVNATKTAVLNNTRGNLLQNSIVYSNTDRTIANTDLKYENNVFSIGGNSRLLLRNEDSFTNFSNGGAFTNMGDMSVAESLLVGSKIGVGQTSLSYQLNILGDINFTGILLQNGKPFESPIWGVNETNVYPSSAANLGIFTTSPTHALEVVGGTRVTESITVANFRATTFTSTNLQAANVSTGTLHAVSSTPSIATFAPRSLEVQQITLGSLRATNAFIDDLPLLQGTAAQLTISQDIIANNATLDSASFLAAKLQNVTAANFRTTYLTTGSVVADTFSADSVTLSTMLTASNVAATALTSNTVSSTTLSANIAHVSATLQADALFCDSVSGGSLFSEDVTAPIVHATTASVGTLEIPTFASETLQTGSLDAESGSVQRLQATNVSSANIELSGDLTITGTLTVVNVTAVTSIMTSASTGSLHAQSVNVSNDIHAQHLNATNTTIVNLLTTGDVTQTDFSRGNSTFDSFHAVDAVISSGHIALSDESELMSSETLAFKTNNNNVLEIGDDTVAHQPLHANHNSNTVGSIVTTGGNVGIGVVPQSRLHIRDQALLSSTTGNVGLAFGIDVNGNTTRGASIAVQEGQLRFATGQLNAVSIDTNVHIGTTSGTAKLSVQQSISTDHLESLNSLQTVNATATSATMGHIIPDTTEVLDLGLPSKRWRDLYLSDSSLYLGDVKLSLDTAGNLVIPTGITVPSGRVNNMHLPTLNKYAVAEKAQSQEAMASWYTRSIPALGWSGMTWSPDLARFAAVSTSGTIMTSDNGLTWTTRAATQQHFTDIAASKAGFVAVSKTSVNNLVATSTNGISWTTQTGVESSTWNAVIWAPDVNLFVAVSDSGQRVMTSPDGVTWTTRAASADLQSVARSPQLGIFTAVGTGVVTSSDGTTWTTQTSSGTYNSVAWSPELSTFAAVGAGVVTSSDGTTWTTRSAPTTEYSQVIWSRELGMFVGTSSSNELLTSNDGIVWVTRSAGMSSAQATAWAPELSILVAVKSGMVMTSKPVLPRSGNTLKTFGNNLEFVGDIKAENAVASTLQVTDLTATTSFTTQDLIAGGVVTNDIIATGASASNAKLSTISTGTLSANVLHSSSVLTSNATFGSLSVGSFSAASLVSNAVSAGNLFLTTFNAPHIATGNMTSATLNANAATIASLNAIAVSTGNLRLSGSLSVGGSILNSSGQTFVMNNWTTAANSLLSTTVNNVYLGPQTYVTNGDPQGPGRVNDVNITALKRRTQASNNEVERIVNTWTTRAVNTNTWSNVIWAAELGLFVAVSASGSGDRVMTSPDGSTWTTRTTSDNNWSSIAWSSDLGVLAAVATSGTGTRVMTSTNGMSWTTRASAADNTWEKVVWAAELGMFVAVSSTGTDDRVMTSTNGINWTARNTSVNNEWCGLAWSAELGVFVAVARSGTGNRVMTSTDGIVWTSRTSAGDFNWTAVSWSPDLGLFVCVSDTSSSMTSPNGVTWTLRTADSSSDVTWVPGLARFVGVGANKALSSRDAITWTTYAATTGAWKSVAWSRELGLFAAVTNDGSEKAITTSYVLPRSKNSLIVKGGVLTAGAGALNVRADNIQGGIASASVGNLVADTIVSPLTRLNYSSATIGTSTLTTTSVSAGNVRITNASAGNLRMLTLGVTDAPVVSITLNNSLEFGAGLTKAQDAGRFKYVDGQAFQWYGAGTSVGDRKIRAWDSIAVGGGVGTHRCLIYGNTTWTSTNLTSNKFFDTNNNVTLNPGNANLGCFASNDVWSGTFFVGSSDTRIKKDAVLLDTSNALQTILAVQPKEYRYKDVVSRGSEPVWGFLAQQVKAVLPVAVKQSPDYLPNVYDFAAVTVEDGKTILELTSASTTALLASDDGQVLPDLRLIDHNNKARYPRIVSVLDDKRIEINESVEGSHVLVYGQKVEDYHMLNKDAIFTVAVAALQEIDKQLESDKQKNMQLREKMTTLQATLQDLEQQLAL